jgi:hypothetical protein
VPAELAKHTVEFGELGDSMRESLLPKPAQAGFLPENLLFDAVSRASAKFELGFDWVRSEIAIPPFAKCHAS